MSVDGSPREDGRNTGLGIVLIGLGAVFLAGQIVGFEVGRYGWPFIVIAAGALALVLGISGVDPSRGLVYPGIIGMTVGGILLYQNTYDHWESWAYAWALIPASVGLARALHASLTGEGRRDVRGGLSMAGWFAAFFVVGFAFFEGVLNISGRGYGGLAQYAVPLLLIAAGLWMLVGRFGWRSS